MNRLTTFLGLILLVQAWAGRGWSDFCCSGINQCDGAECVAKEQALVLYSDESDEITVVQPNEDGTYWRKVVRNKMYRTREKRNVDAAKKFIQSVLPDQDHDVMSSYGPYISTVGQVMGVSTKALPFKAEDTTKLTKSR